MISGLISALPPPVPPYVGALCTDDGSQVAHMAAMAAYNTQYDSGTEEIATTNLGYNSGYGMGQLAILPGLIPAISSAIMAPLDFFGQMQTNKANQKIAAQQAKLARDLAAQDLAKSQLQQKVDAASGKRNTTVYALYAIGGVAGLVALGLFLKGRK